MTGSAAARWAGLDEAQQAALALGWEAFRTGNIGVGAVITDPGGRIVSRGRNRLADASAPPGQVFGTSLAHAEINALANLPFRVHARELVLTTTLQPCLQCSAAIRMAPIARVRVLGADPLWDGCDDFSSLNPWVGRNPPVPVEGPADDEVGLFATLMARCSPFLAPAVDERLRVLGEGPLLELAARLRAAGELEVLAGESVEGALGRLWPALSEVRVAMVR